MSSISLSIITIIVAIFFVIWAMLSGFEVRRNANTKMLTVTTVFAFLFAVSVLFVSLFSF